MKWVQKYWVAIRALRRLKNPIVTEVLSSLVIPGHLINLLKDGLTVPALRSASWRGLFLFLVAASSANLVHAQRIDISLNNDWYTRATDSLQP